MATTHPVNDGQWHRIAAVRDGSEQRLYLDGQLEGYWNYLNGAPVLTGLPTGGLHIGTGGCGTSLFTGQLDEITMADRVWSLAELQAPRSQEQPVANWTYDALSRRTAMTLSNGTQTTYSYDPASQVTNILHQLTATSSQINKADYVYNPVGNRTSLTDRRGNQAFGYDQLDRLTSASHPLLLDPQAFAYDAVGNWTTNGSVVNAGNQLTADANFAYQYDDNGNLTRKTLLATGNYSQYTYDAENRLTKVEEFAAGNPTPAFTSTYRYDGLGRRIEKVANGTTRRYVYDRDQILLEYDGTNALQARYTYGPRMDEPIAITRGASTFFYHVDGLNSITDLTDSSGSTVQSYAYDVWGNVLQQTGTIENSFVFTGRERDSETSLYYYRARSYEPQIGRFLQKDPLGGDQGKNLYPYVQNNPVNRIDPSGKADISACSYYDQLCAKSGGQCRYYCNASTLCRNAPYLPFLWGASASQISCIRGMLIDYDKLFNKDKSNLTVCPECLKDSIIDDYHRAAYSQCGVEPWLYPGLRPLGLDFRMGNDRN